MYVLKWQMFPLGFLLVFSLIAPPPSTAAHIFYCGEGMELILSSVEPLQGRVFLAEIHGSAADGNFIAEWNDRKVPFWKSGAGQGTYQALIGVDLDQQSQPALIRIRSELDSEVALHCATRISVQKGKYTVERLRVAQKYLDLTAKDLARYRREVKRLKNFWNTATPERFWDGGFRIPLAKSRGSSNFGRRRILNGQPRSPHSGEDFPASRGTPVYATQRGRVVMADDLFFSGNTVVLDHGLGLYTLYAHLDSMAVKEGEMAASNSLIGRVGATGRVTGPHLHWAVRLNGARVNPLDLVELIPSRPPAALPQ